MVTSDPRPNQTYRLRQCICMAIAASALACHATAADRNNVTAGTLTISNAYLVAPIGEAPAAMYFTVRNSGATADTLTGIRVTGVAHAELHMEVMSHMPSAMPQHTPQSMPPMTMTTMVPTPEVPVPAGGVLLLAPMGRHVMLMGMQRHFGRGDSTDANLIFKHAGTVHIPVRVIDYTQIDTLAR